MASRSNRRGDRPCDRGYVPLPAWLSDEGRRTTEPSAHRGVASPSSRNRPLDARGPPREPHTGSRLHTGRGGEDIVACRPARALLSTLDCAYGRRTCHGPVRGRGRLRGRRERRPSRPQELRRCARRSHRSGVELPDRLRAGSRGLPRSRRGEEFRRLGDSERFRPLDPPRIAVRVRGHAPGLSRDSRSLTDRRRSSAHHPGRPDWVEARWDSGRRGGTARPAREADGGRARPRGSFGAGRRHRYWPHPRDGACPGERPGSGRQCPLWRTDGHVRLHRWVDLCPGARRAPVEGHPPAPGASAGRVPFHGGSAVSPA